MNNKTKLIFISLLAFLYSMSFISCSSDDSSDDSGLKGWYVDKETLASANDFIEINKAIDQDEILSQYTYGGTTHKTIASRSLFFNADGRYTDSDASFGRVRFSVNSCINVYRIIDDSTMMVYIGWLYKLNATGAQNKERLYTFDAGYIFGSMAYYADSPKYVSYVKADNKIVTTEGEIFTITTLGLVKDGSSRVLSRYTPN